MTILCLDVGFAHCGWAIVNATALGNELEAFGCIHTDKMEQMRGESDTCFDMRRAKSLYRSIKGIIETHQSSVVVGEVPHGGSQNARAGAAMGMAKVVAVLAADGKECYWERAKRTKRAAKLHCFEQWPDAKWPRFKRDSEHIFDALSCFSLWQAARKVV